MPNLLALSFEGQVAPSFRLKCLEPGRHRPDGWGLGYYPGSEPSAVVLKEPAPPASSIRSDLVRIWEHLESPLFVLHVRAARWGSNTLANTQPFARHHGGREWLFAHSGNLDTPHDLPTLPPYEPVGSTDTERLFCAILSRLRERGVGRLADLDARELAQWFAEWNRMGSLTNVLTDGLDLCVWADDHGELCPTLHSFVPPYERAVFADDDVELDLTQRGAMSRRGVVVSSNALQALGNASVETSTLRPGDLVIVRGGVVHREVRAAASTSAARITSAAAVQEARRGASLLPPRAATYRILHRTTYSYEREVEHSTHVLKLFPFEDRHQDVDNFDLRVSGAHRGIDFDDVFGNRARRLTITSPYRTLSIEAESTVRVHPPGLDFARPGHTRILVPVVWMPWQRHMLQPYLLPPELYESELAELTDYAMNFVRRNDGDLVDTLLDLNRTLHREYAYVPGVTHVGTTAFEVYTSRRGVCQDFANVFICLARLLGVPARYVVGYVHVPTSDARSAAALASHAWAEVYLPDVGWRGFDPTNGTVAHTDHVRVAVGRTYRDATPTAGTIFVGGGGERLEVEVRVEPA